MTVIVAGANGNWSNPATWIGGVVPGPGDTAQTGNFTVTINVDVTVDLLEGTSSNGSLFIVSTERIINADLKSSGNTSNGVIRCQHPSGTVVINGHCTLVGNQNSAVGILVMSAGGTVIVNGDVVGGSGANAYGVWNQLAGTVIINGKATGGSGANAHGASNGGGGTMLVQTAVGNNFGPGGSTANQSFGVFGSGANGQTTKVGTIEFGPYGASPIGGAVLLDPSLAPGGLATAEFRTAYGGATKTLVDSGAGADLPVPADVRGGTIYNVGNMTGTLAVPAAGSVALGVPVDAGVGTAVLTAAAVGAQLETALGTTARAEPVAVPAANASFAAKLNWIYALLRNKRIEDIDGARLRDSTDTADIGTIALEDTAGVFTQGGWQ